MSKEDAIDWKELRRRIAETPIIIPPKHIKRPNRSPESLEKRRKSSRERWKKFYYNNLEYCHERQKQWEHANPEKMKAKRSRYYAKLKLDPERLERKRQRNREYKARKRMEKLAAQAA